MLPKGCGNADARAETTRLSTVTSSPVPSINLIGPHSGWECCQAGSTNFRNAFPDAIVEIVARALHAVALPTRIRPPQALGWRNVQEQREIGHQSARRQPIGSAHFLFRQAAPHDLVRIGGKKEAVEENHVALGQRGPDLPRDQLRARRHEEQSFSRMVHVMVGFEDNRPNRVAHWSSTGLADSDARNSGLRQSLGNQSDLSGLPRAFGSLEDDQLTAGHAQERVMIGLAAPFFMPSMIH